MDLITFLTSVFYLADNWLQGQRLRQRGPRPTLCDSEVLTMEIVGEFLGIDTDKGLYDCFRRHHSDCFPALRRIDRTTFTRQAANLWHAKMRLWQHLLQHLSRDADVSLIDSFPMPVCRFARAYRCRTWAEWAAFGYGELAKQTFYGLRVHLLVSWPGVIVGIRLVPADVHDLQVADDLLTEASGWVLGDRNCGSAKATESWHAQGLQLLAPYKSRRRDKPPRPRWLVQKRRRIETVIGQLVEVPWQEGLGTRRLASVVSLVA